jgi:hypothetical protein
MRRQPAIQQSSRHGMDRVRASAIARIEGALRSTLDDIHARVRNGAGRSTVTELVRHARELAALLDQAIDRLEGDPDSAVARSAAVDLAASLRLLENELANKALH